VKIYEVLDVTSDEAYHTIGLFSSLEKALATQDGTEPESDQLEYYDGCTFNVRERDLDQYSGWGKWIAVVKWTYTWSDDGENKLWHKEVIR
jgi:hypothetical protein